MNPLELLSGDPETFITEVWGRRSLVHEADPSALAELFSIDHADELITVHALRTPQVRLAQDGKVLDQTGYTKKATIAGQPMTGLLDARKVLALFDGGATIVFQGLQRYWEPLRRLVRGLEAELGHPCQANAYLTPPGAQGFALHSDSHDVFTFQTFGTKEWEFHADDARHELRMVPGTCLYLPTGTPHLARTGAGEPSLHVTVGINQVVWADVLRDLVHRVIDAEAGYADHMPAGRFRDPDALAEALTGRLTHLAARLGAVDVAAEVDRMEARFETGRQPLLAGALRDVLDVRALEMASPLRRRAGTRATLHERGDRLDVLLGDRCLTVPARIRASVEHVLNSDHLTPADVPGLDGAGALVLCRRLVREGLLEVVR